MIAAAASIAYGVLYLAGVLAAALSWHKDFAAVADLIAIALGYLCFVNQVDQGHGIGIAPDLVKICVTGSWIFGIVAGLALFF